LGRGIQEWEKFAIEGYKKGGGTSKKTKKHKTNGGGKGGERIALKTVGGR